jgi:hypothetical protein
MTSAFVADILDEQAGECLALPWVFVGVDSRHMQIFEK